MAHVRLPLDKICLVAGEGQRACWDAVDPKAAWRLPGNRRAGGILYELQPGNPEPMRLVPSRGTRVVPQTIDQNLADWGIRIPTGVRSFERIRGVRAELYKLRQYDS